MSRAAAFGETAADLVLGADAFDEQDRHAGCARDGAGRVAMGAALKRGVEDRAASGGELGARRVVHRRVGRGAALRRIERRRRVARSAAAPARRLRVVSELMCAKPVRSCSAAATRRLAAAAEADDDDQTRRVRPRVAVGEGEVRDGAVPRGGARRLRRPRPRRSSGCRPCRGCRRAGRRRTAPASADRRRAASSA